VKTIRNRLLKYALAILFGKFDLSAFCSAIDWYFNLCSVPTDKSGMGQMRDVYLIALFQIEYVLELFQKNSFAGGLVLLPWSLMFLCFRSSPIYPSACRCLLEFAAHVLFPFLDEFLKGWPEQGSRQSTVNAFRHSTLARALNPLFDLASAIETFGNPLPLDRSTTNDCNS
jgi:hypothetical protein